MYYDFIEIGVTQGLTCIEIASNQTKGLTIDFNPTIVSMLHAKANVNQVVAAISSYDGIIKTYYVNDDGLQAFALQQHWWLRGCNELVTSSPYKKLEHVLEQAGCSDPAKYIAVYNVPVLSISSLFELYSVTGCSLLKLNCGEHNQVILQSYIEALISQQIQPVRRIRIQDDKDCNNHNVSVKWLEMLGYKIEVHDDETLVAYISSKATTTDFNTLAFDFPSKQRCNMLVSVEGNIGSGKSTLLEALSQQTLCRQHTVVYEDVKTWTAVLSHDGHSLLEMYYKDPEMYSYAFQSIVLVSRIQSIIEAINNPNNAIVITERSHLSDLFIFAKNLYDSNKMTELSWKTLCKSYEILMKLLSVSIDLTIYLDTTPECCLERINKRARKGEELISKEYIEQIDRRHQDWINTLDSTKVLVVDGNVDLSQSKDREALIVNVVADINNRFNRLS